MNEKKEDEIYCPECGKVIKRKSVICLHCGIQINELEVKKVIIGKSKTVAIILAILFSFFSWLYTYKKNINKFLISILANLILLNLVGYFKIEAAINTLIWLIILLFVVIWIWAIVDNARRPNSFYENYPK